MGKLLIGLTWALLATTTLASGGEVFYPEKASFDPFPRELPRRGTITFKVTLKRGFSSPKLVITEPGGATRYEEPSRMSGSKGFEFDVEFREQAGRFRVELVVDSVRGDTTAAQFTMWVGVPKPEVPDEDDVPRPQSEYEPERSDESTVRLERKFFHMMNEYREKLGLEPYPWLEQAAQLARLHMEDFLKIEPRPDKLTHQIPGHGFIADRFMEVLAWPSTVRKFPLKDPNVGPEAVCYCAESLAAPRSLEWLFKEYFIRESAFRAPVISEYPTHAAVGIVRDEDSGRLYTVAVYVQVNSTRVLAELAAEVEETRSSELKAGEPALRAELLRRLGRMGDAESVSLFKRRLGVKEPEVRAAALDALFLDHPDAAEKQVERWVSALARARTANDYASANQIIATLASVEYDAATRLRGIEALRAEERLASDVMRFAEMSVKAGDLEDARATLTHLAERLEGLPLAEKVRERLAKLGD